MLAKEIMKKHVECLLPDDAAVVAARKMRDENVGFLPVCDTAGKPVGTLTDRDIVVRMVADDRSAMGTSVKDIMSKELVSCGPDDDVRTAERLMGQNRKSRILVVDAEKVLGVISLSDIAQADEPRRVAKIMREVTEREAPHHS